MEVVVESREYSLLASTTLTDSESGVPLHRSANFVSESPPLALQKLPTPSRNRPRVGNFLNAAASELFVLQVLPHN